MAFVALIALVAALGIVPGSTQVAQAGGGPINVPWLRVYQIDPQAVNATDPYSGAVAVAFDTAGLGSLEMIEVCHTPSGCSAFRPGYFFGGYVWGDSIQSGWTWIATFPPTWGTYQARAFLVTSDGRRETITAEPVELQPSREAYRRGASNEVWTFIDQSPTRIGETLKLRIERDLGLPVISAEVCIVGMNWSCQYENQKDWGLLLNGAGTQYLGLVLSHPNIVREGPQGKLVSFPNGASIRVRYTMVDGSSVTYQSQPLFFLP